MAYAVVQNEMVKPSREALEAAFGALTEFVNIDAATFSNDAYGIITGGLDYDHAACLSSALLAQGVSTQVVDESEFPPLTPPRHLRRLDCTREHLVLYDALGRTTPVSWNRVAMVAAGLVTVTEFERTEKTSVVVGGGGSHAGARPILLTDVSHGEEANTRLVLEIFMDIAPVRVGAKGDECQYDYLGDCLKLRYMDNFAIMVQDVATFANNAILNRGATSLRDGNAATFHYPTRHAFEEEIVWLLWTGSRSRRSKQSTQALA